MKYPLADIPLQKPGACVLRSLLAASAVLGVLYATTVMPHAAHAQTPAPNAVSPADEELMKAFREKMAQERQDQKAAAATPAAPATTDATTAAVAPATAATATAAATTAAPATNAAPAAQSPLPTVPVAAVPATPADNASINTLDNNLGINAANPLGPAANLPLNGLPSGPQTQTEIQAALEAEGMMQRKKIEDQVFEEALKQIMPLRPDQVRSLLGKFQENREAAETPYTNPEPKQIVQTVSMDPSEAPPVIKTAPGNVTTVTILDSSGAPWPIQDISWAGKFTVTPPESGGHILRITPQSAHGVGNISIRLVDLIAPITMTLKTGLDEVYYRFDARIPKSGPLAKAPLIEYGGLKSIAGKDTNISSLLDGTPPTGATKMKVQGTDGRTQAWRISDKVYLRTPLTLLSPGWDSSASSADGMNVYTIPQAPVILLSDQGRMVQTRIGDEEVRY